MDNEDITNEKLLKEISIYREMINYRDKKIDELENTLRNKDDFNILIVNRLRDLENYIKDLELRCNNLVKREEYLLEIIDEKNTEYDQLLKEYNKV